MNRSDSDGNRWPRIAARVLVVLAAVAILLALVAAYARQSAVDSDQFANRAGAALRDDSVRSLLAQKITDEVVLKNEADLIAARPIIDSVASEIIGSRAFTGLFRRAVRDVHRALFKRDKASVTLTIADVGTVLAAALEQVRPALARELPSTERVEVVRENIGSLSATLVNIAERVQILAILLIVIALVLGAGALIVAPDKRDTVIELGLGAAAAGGLLAIGLVPVVVIVPVVAAFLGTGGTTTAAPAAGGCNGHEELCERPFDRVVLPMTHNSMSVPLPGWYSSMQEKPIADQLRDGIRGLMIDTHCADRLPNGKVRTYFGSREELKRRTKVDGVSPDAVDAALNLRDRLGFSGEGERGMYLCHSFCELGATRLDSVLDDLRTFLAANPGAVVVVINQDYVTAQDFVEAVRDADLEELVYKGPVDGEWPTLREMVESNQRLVLPAENHAGGALVPRRLRQDHPGDPVRLQKGRPAYETGQPRQELRAEPRAGGRARLPGEPLDHDRPGATPSNASKVNAYDPILARVRDCQRIRHHLTNLVSVNFYLRGDLFKVVDTLNGLD